MSILDGYLFHYQDFLSAFQIRIYCSLHNNVNYNQPLLFLCNFILFKSGENNVLQDMDEDSNET